MTYFHFWILNLFVFDMWQQKHTPKTITFVWNYGNAGRPLPEKERCCEPSWWCIHLINSKSTAQHNKGCWEFAFCAAGWYFALMVFPLLWFMNVLPKCGVWRRHRGIKSVPDHRWEKTTREDKLSDCTNISIILVVLTLGMKSSVSVTVVCQCWCLLYFVVKYKFQSRSDNKNPSSGIRLPSAGMLNKLILK